MFRIVQKAFCQSRINYNLHSTIMVLIPGPANPEGGI